MLAGTILRNPKDKQLFLPEVENLGQIKQAKQIGGGEAPLISREALEKAGNWNPFVICMEEEDLAIRLRHYIPGAKLFQSESYTVYSPACPLSLWEFWRRWKRGFVKGPGQIIKNAIADGYWRQCLHLAKSSLLFIVLIVGLAITIPLDLWWQFLLCFFGAAALRAIFTGKLVRFKTLFYSLATGAYSLWEFLTVPVRTSKDYICDYGEVKKYQ